MSTPRTQTPTFINLPPPSDPMTPSDAPGTPNSTTTSMSELSTVAIKDGHRGHLPHHSQQPGGPLEAERADRISRLAGLDRLGHHRTLTPTSQAGSQYTGGVPPHMQQAYFDANNQPTMMRERSTVGSASATGSVGGRTTWASGSDVFGEDKMSVEEDMEVEAESVGGVSADDTGSLVGFGEGARTPARQLSSVGSPTPGSKGPLAGVGAGMTPTGREREMQQARMLDGMTYDSGVLDTANRTPPPADEDMNMK